MRLHPLRVEHPRHLGDLFNLGRCRAILGRTPLTMDRRTFLRSALAGAGAIALGDAFRLAALAGPATDASQSSYGKLGNPDADGLMYPTGFQGRVIARSGAPVGLTSHVWPIFPDGAATFVQPDGGWILVVNSENPPAADVPILPEVQDLLGGASAIRFDKDGKIVDAYWVLKNTRSNCAGGKTPWDTWLSCEEVDYTVRNPAAPPSDAGLVFECSPTDRGGKKARPLPLLGRFKHEAAAFDGLGRVYLTEDMPDGCLYRFTPSSDHGNPASLHGGTLEALRIDSNGEAGSVSWVGPIVPDAATTATRKQQPNATKFKGGEGCFYANGVVLFTTKGDDRVWALTLGSGSTPDSIEVLYDGPGIGGHAVLNGVDNIIVSPHTGNIYVAEDGGDMEIVVIETKDDGTRTAAALLRATGPQHGYGNPTPVPSTSEVTGLALNPDGTRLYFNGQRTYGTGVSYELTAGPEQKL